MIRLFKNYFTHRQPARRAELDEVRRRDEANRLLTIHAIPDRPTFAKMFEAANASAGPDDVCIVANADISFGPDIALAENMAHDEAYALARWDDTEDGLVLFADKDGKPRIDAMDAWIFKGPIRQYVIDNTKYMQGQRGADNNLGAVLADAGYRVSNPALSIKCIHLHRTEIRQHGMAVGKPYLCIPPHALGETPELRWNREETRTEAHRTAYV